jgi:hypothetical protein
MPIRGSQMEIAGQICRRRRSSRLLSAITSLPGARRLAGAAEVAGLAAAGLSIVQCVLGLLLAGRLAPGGDSPAAGSIFQPVSRVDGTKMLLLAVVAVSAIALARRWTVYGLPQRRAGGRTDRIGARCLLLSLALAWSGYVSLPVLLIWMADAAAMPARAMC